MTRGYRYRPSLGARLAAWAAGAWRLLGYVAWLIVGLVLALLVVCCRLAWRR